MAVAAIRTTALSKAFRRRPVVRAVSLSVSEGGVYAFLGPNGAGKTTTMRLLLGLLRPDAGEIAIFNKTLAAHRAEILARTGALVETPSLYPHLSARENLAIVARMLGAPSTEIDRVLAIVGLELRGGHIVRTYSLGMTQRLGLAQALLGRRELLLLDEPMNGLDPAGITDMRGLIRDLPRRHGVTVMLSSHLLAEVELVADEVGVLSQGELVFQGPTAGLLRLGKPRLSVGVDRVDDACALLTARGWQATGANGRLAVTAERPADAVAVNRLLVEAGHAVHHLAVEAATLEDVFLSMTTAEVR